MTKYIYFVFSLIMITAATSLEAGNPDRQGEAGAYELLMNPWARSAGLHTMNTSFIKGAEAMRVNPAGLSRVGKTEVLIAHTRYLEGTDLKFNALGFSQKMGKNSAIGVTLMAIDFGEIPVTTEALPQGTGATYSPSYFNLGLGYAHTFENKVSVGITFRVISEALSNVTAFGFAIDAGVQYVTGPQDNFKIGIALRSIGSPMQFSGQGLSEQLTSPDADYPNTYFARANAFELPSLLNMGASYDFILDEKNRLTVLGNFTSNSFSSDQYGVGLEYSLNEMFMLRGAYRYETAENDDAKSAYTGISGGFSIEVPLKKESGRKFGIDYAYRASQPFNGTHNIGIRFNL